MSLSSNYFSYEAESEIVGAMLPERLYFSRSCQYGVPFVAAEYCDLTQLSQGMVLDEWQHGWHPPEHNIHPEYVIGNNGLSRQLRDTKQFFVARQDQVDYLKSHGYKKIKAIGMPIIYVDVPKIDREPGSLLIMPVHTLDHTTLDIDFESYIDSIVSVSDKFSNIVACIHPSCIKKSYWVDSFIERGISVISGAHIADQNSLLRMAVLFSKFEFVTSNGLGSHLAYSAFFGAKPSIYGHLVKYETKNIHNEGIYKNCPELTPILRQKLTAEYKKKIFSCFYCMPWEAEECIEWAEFQLGKKHKLTPEELLVTYLNNLGDEIEGLKKISSKLERIKKHCLFGILISFWRKFINQNFEVFE